MVSLIFQIQSELAAAATASAASIAALETRIGSTLDSLRTAFATCQQQQQQQQQHDTIKLQIEQQNQQFQEQHKQQQTALARTARRFEEWTVAHEAAELQYQARVGQMKGNNRHTQIFAV